MKRENRYLYFLQRARAASAKLLAKSRPHQEITDNLLRSIPLWIASLLAGLVAVLYTKIFAIAEDFSLKLFTQASWLTFIVTPFCFLLSWLVVRRFAPFARGSGIPQTIANVPQQLGDKHAHRSDQQ